MSYEWFSRCRDWLANECPNCGAKLPSPEPSPNPFQAIKDHYEAFTIRETIDEFGVIWRARCGPCMMSDIIPTDAHVIKRAKSLKLEEIAPLLSTLGETES